MEAPKIPGFVGGDILLTYGPTSKIMSVPSEATAFRRSPTTIVLIELAWKDNTPEKERTARKHTQDVADIILHGQSAITIPESLGYANHGTFCGSSHAYASGVISFTLCPRS